MARMHTRRKGKAGSHKPLSKGSPEWMARKPEEVEAIIVKLAKQGKQSAEIGLILRDSYGIPDVRKVLNKKLTQVLRDKGLVGEEPECVVNLKKRLANVAVHMEKNKKDMVSKRGHNLIYSKIMRLQSYYKK